MIQYLHFRILKFPNHSIFNPFRTIHSSDRQTPGAAGMSDPRERAKARAARTGQSEMEPLDIYIYIMIYIYIYNDIYIYTYCRYVFKRWFTHEGLWFSIATSARGSNYIRKLAIWVRLEKYGNSQKKSSGFSSRSPVKTALPSSRTASPAFQTHPHRII